MKSFNIHIVCSLLLSLILLSGCQDEVFEVEELSSEEVVTYDSPLSNLLQGVARKDGSYDNALDESSCISLKLPVKIMVESRVTVLNTEQEVREFGLSLDTLESDDFEFFFPLFVIFSDYTEQLVQNIEELEEAAEICSEEQEDDTISCIDIKYPFSVSVYNSDNQLSNVIELTNDQELLTFLNERTPEDIWNIQFPLFVIKPNGKEVEVKGNGQLKRLIEEAIEECAASDQEEGDDQEDQE